MGMLRNPTEASLLYFASETERMANELSLTEGLAKYSANLYIQALKSEYQPSTIDRATATCLYSAARLRNIPVTIDQVAGVSRRTSNAIYHESNELSKILGTPIEPDDPSDFVSKYVDELAWDPGPAKRAEELCEQVKKEHIHVGHSPSGIAASVLYARSEIEALGYTQSNISEIAGTTTVTIRNTYPEMMKIAPDVEQKDLASRDIDIAFEIIESSLDLSNEICGIARERAKNIEDDDATRGRSRAGIAAAAYLATARENEVDLNRSHLAEIMGISPQTLSSHLEKI